MQTMHTDADADINTDIHTDADIDTDTDADIDNALGNRHSWSVFFSTMSGCLPSFSTERHICFSSPVQEEITLARNNNRPV